jgi:hypothetical protein
MDETTRRVITMSVTISTLALVGGWVGATRLKPARPHEANTLRHPTSTFILATALAACGTALTVLCAGAGPREDIWVPWFFAFMTATPGLLVLDYYRGRHELIDGGMRYGKLFGRGGALRWQDVRTVAYSTSMKWFRLECADGTVVRVSVWLTSLPAFATAVLRGVSPGTIDVKTRAVLEETSAGRPPSIWQP